MTIQISLKNVSKIFGPKPKSVIPMIKQGMTKEDILAKTNHTVGVYDASMDIKKGETFVIMGLSGSGKSTLIRCFNLLNKPTDGEIVLDGENIVAYSNNQLKKSATKQNRNGFSAFWAVYTSNNLIKCRVWIRNQTNA